MLQEETPTLEELLKFRGPLRKSVLEKQGIDIKKCAAPHVVIAPKIRQASYPAAEMLPGMSGEIIFFPHSQLLELGLIIGRQIPQDKSQQFYRAMTVLARDILSELPKVQAIVRMHYLSKGCENPYHLYGNFGAFYQSLQEQGYTAVRGHGAHSAWTNTGWHALAMVHENKRQASTIQQIDANRKALERKDIAYEDAAKALGWTPAHAENYRVLAREAGQRPNMFVIGTGWQRRLEFDLEKVDTKSNATAEVAYWLLRTDSGCTVEQTLGWLCGIASVVRDVKRYEFDCSQFERSKQDEFLEKQGYIKITVDAGEGSLQRAKIEITPRGRALHRRLGAEGRLDGDGQYAHI